MENKISFGCPDCGIKIKHKNIKAGQITKCENCGCKIKFIEYGSNRLTFCKFGEVKAECRDKPPLGLTPKRIVDLQRAADIMGAVNRYFEYNKAIPIEWMEEYNQIIQNKD